MDFLIRFNLISIFPSMFTVLSQGGIISRAIKKHIIALETLNPRHFTKDKHKTIDSSPYGGGDGMLMKAEPLKKSLEFLDEREKKGHVIYLSPQGEKWTNQKAKSLAKKKIITLISGRYAGVDQRFINQFVDEEISIGDYILSGGELAAMVLIDTITRFLPSVLNHRESNNEDSFKDFLLEAPQFTRPPIFERQRVPSVLMSGDHKKIRKWKRQVSLVKTFQKREDLFETSKLKNQGKITKELKTAILELSHWNEEDLESCDLQNIKEIKTKFKKLNP